ncbi:ABC transporter permease [Parasphingorhabdus cellanae]|uniref:ABC transporter permease n=1 Tax=Parasphingorhabdus cellanae TaxID=2806553 RepID=A0ABX7T5L5_9SPHN|nr:ABC transporter permease [Parasphingorhabdus cellanae]QTD56884.1 ABC transporter permease [Parasphingorhabdus cellanae]
MFGLALAYLRDRSLTTGLNILLLGISVAMLVLLVQFGNQLSSRLDRDAQGIDLVVGAKGSPLQLILSSIFHIDQPTGNIPLDSLDRLRGDPAVKVAIPLALGDNFDGYRIVGTDASYATFYGGEIAQGQMFEKPMDAVMGAAVAKTTGAQLGQQFIGSHGLETDEGDGQGHDHAPFETVGILAPTGTVVDRLILTSVESVWDVHGIEHDHGHDHSDQPKAVHDHGHNHGADDAAPSGAGQLQPELTAILVSYRNAAGAIRIPAMINRQTEMQAATPAVETARLLALFGAGIEGARIFAWILAATGGLAIFIALLNMARAREGDLALLRVMGASKPQVFGTILLEGLITAAAGATLGLAAAHGALFVAGRSFQTLSDLGLSATQFLPAELGIVAAVLFIGIIAALVPAARVFRINLANTLARTS